MSKLSRIKTNLCCSQYAGICLNNFILCFLLATFLSIPGTSGLRILEARIPVYKLRGEDAELSCTYDLEKDTLYSVKWYKDDEEFYRYMPASYPPQQLFKRPGVRVHHSKSNASHVVLTQLDFSSSGLYRCEISVENLFNTLNRFGRLLVVELPNEGPRITGVKDKYEYGEFLKANCSSSRSHPAAQLSWEINKQKVLPKHTYSHPPLRHPDGLESSKLELMVQMDEHHFVNGAMRLRCVATVAAIYTSSEQDYLEEDRLVNKPIVLEQRDHLISVNGASTLAERFRLPFGLLDIVLFFFIIFQFLLVVL